MEDVCSEHSGCKTDIQNLKDETLRQDVSIKRMDAKLNMIIGAAIISPFIWSVLSVLLIKMHTGG